MLDGVWRGAARRGTQGLVPGAVWGLILTAGGRRSPRRQKTEHSLTEAVPDSWPDLDTLGLNDPLGLSQLYGEANRRHPKHLCFNRLEMHEPNV